MLELIATICLLTAPETCREALIPAAACQAPGYRPPPGWEMRAPPRCQTARPGAAVREIAPGVFVHEGAIAEPGPTVGGDSSNAGFVIGTEAIAVIDSTGALSSGEALYRAIRARSDLPIRHVILTHMHPDHIFGASLFAEAGAEIIGHPGLPRALADRGDSYLRGYGDRLGAAFAGSRLPQITREIGAGLSLDLGGRVLDLRAWPMAHSPTDVTVLDRRTGTLFAGDLVFHIHTPALDGDLTGWQEALAALRGPRIRRIVPGHGPAALSPEAALDPMARYLGVLARDSRAAIARGDSLSDAAGQIAQSERPHWQLFDQVNPRNATAAFAELEWE